MIDRVWKREQSELFREIEREDKSYSDIMFYQEPYSRTPKMAVEFVEHMRASDGGLKYTRMGKENAVKDEPVTSRYIITEEQFMALSEKYPETAKNLYEFCAEKAKRGDVYACVGSVYKPYAVGNVDTMFASWRVPGVDMRAFFTPKDDQRITTDEIQRNIDMLRPTIHQWQSDTLSNNKGYLHRIAFVSKPYELSVHQTTRIPRLNTHKTYDEDMVRDVLGIEPDRYGSYTTMYQTVFMEAQDQHFQRGGDPSRANPYLATYYGTEDATQDKNATIREKKKARADHSVLLDPQLMTTLVTNSQCERKADGTYVGVINAIVYDHNHSGAMHTKDHENEIRGRINERIPEWSRNAVSDLRDKPPAGCIRTVCLRTYDGLPEEITPYATPAKPFNEKLHKQRVAQNIQALKRQQTENRRMIGQVSREGERMQQLEPAFVEAELPFVEY